MSDIIDFLQNQSKLVQDLILFQYRHYLMVFVVQHPAYFGKGQCPIDPKVLQGSWRNAQEFSDLIGFEPFLWSLAILVLKQLFDLVQELGLELKEVIGGNDGC